MVIINIPAIGTSNKNISNTKKYNNLNFPIYQDNYLDK